MVKIMTAEKTVPVVGMGATLYLYTDRQAHTVVEVINDKTIVVQRDHAKAAEGEEFPVMNWDLTRNPNGSLTTYTLRKNGAWVTRGVPTRGASTLVIGYRREYYDPHF